MCRVLKHFVKYPERDEHGKSQWIECPECEGLDSENCQTCKGSGIKRKGKR